MTTPETEEIDLRDLLHRLAEIYTKMSKTSSHRPYVLRAGSAIWALIEQNAYLRHELELKVKALAEAQQPTVTLE